MMFSIPFEEYEPDPEIVKALHLILILHADHEQNCSSSTVRMVASTGANLFASCAAGVCALWGPLHGGANAVRGRNAPRRIHNNGRSRRYHRPGQGQELAAPPHGFRPPRLQELRSSGQHHQGALRQAASTNSTSTTPCWRSPSRLEETALNDHYFIERKLYPNVDFYSRHHHAGHGHPREHVHRHLRHGQHARLDRQLEGGERRRRGRSTGPARSTSAASYATTCPWSSGRSRPGSPAPGDPAARGAAPSESSVHRWRPAGGDAGAGGGRRSGPGAFAGSTAAGAKYPADREVEPGQDDQPRRPPPQAEACGR